MAFSSKGISTMIGNFILLCELKENLPLLIVSCHRGSFLQGPLPFPWRRRRRQMLHCWMTLGKSSACCVQCCCHDG